MSTILKALRRLEEDRQSRSSKTARPVDAIPATDHQAADGLRERILVEESVAQAAADTAEHESDRSRRLIMKGAAAALLTLGLAVAAYTVLWAGIDSGPSPNVIAATPERVPTPETEALPSGEGLAGVESARVSRGQSADSLMPAAPSLARFANSRRSNRPQNDEGNEFGEFQPDQALSDSQGGSQPSTAPPVAVPVPVPVAVGSIDASSAAAVASGVTPNEPRAGSAGAKSVASPPLTPPSAAAEMALGAVTPTPAVRAANSPRTVAATDASLASTPTEPASPPRRPEPTLTAKTAKAPPSVSARQATPPPPIAKTKPTKSQPSRQIQPSRESQSPKKSQPRQEPQHRQQSQPSSESGSVAHLDRPDLPDLTILRTSWHPNADRRSAKIRLEASDEIMNLREGDAIGGLVIQEISPSAVVFKAGDVEIRRRVGHPGSRG